MREANKFKGSALLKAVKSWAGLYLIQLLTQLCYPYYFFFFCTAVEYSSACAGNKTTRRIITHLLIAVYLTHTHKRHPRSGHTLPLQRSHLNQVRINHCQWAAYLWPSTSHTGQRWNQGNKHDIWVRGRVCAEKTFKTKRKSADSHSRSILCIH